ncbi:MAG: hypothetical protein A2Y25_03400 [Candidatus Melainabacteria bacterium GWF2_37_15]|nr:MAG: hypothetical protein A2Y25_03400 [Candidatus Melainabacteria bacterium GWF2_37_15]
MRKQINFKTINILVMLALLFILSSKAAFACNPLTCSGTENLPAGLYMQPAYDFYITDRTYYSDRATEGSTLIVDEETQVKISYLIFNMNSFADTGLSLNNLYLWPKYSINNQNLSIYLISNNNLIQNKLNNLNSSQYYSNIIYPNATNSLLLGTDWINKYDNPVEVNLTNNNLITPDQFILASDNNYYLQLALLTDDRNIYTNLPEQVYYSVNSTDPDCHPLLSYSTVPAPEPASIIYSVLALTGMVLRRKKIA